MGEIDYQGTYIAHIPYSDCDAEGEIILKSNNKRLNDFLETHLRKLLRDIYYERCEEFNINE